MDVSEKAEEKEGVTCELKAVWVLTWTEKRGYDGVFDTLCERTWQQKVRVMANC